jgi:hypothetical protein
MSSSSAPTSPEKKADAPTATVIVDVHGERLGLYIVPESEVVSLARPPQAPARP